MGKKGDILLESKSLCDDNYEIVQNTSDKTHRTPIEVKTLGDFVKKLKHICNRLKIFLFAFFEWFIHLRSWVIMTTTLNILFSLLLWLGASVVEEDDDMSDVMIFFIVCSVIPLVIVLVKPSVLGFKERVKSAFLLLIPIAVYSFSYFTIKSMEKEKKPQ